uniref:F-box associated beta-propeller type 1 domain-containing protein n=1 Tax=Fagus sylvatica TaxID=28930 RepID=A0A2N9J2A3_FAGSY
MELCRLICNNDNTLSELSRIKIPFSIANASNVCFCNGMFCFAEHKTLIYLWNPSIRKFKKLEASRFNYPRKVTFGLAYHSQNNDFKILRIVSFIYNHIPTEPIPVVAQIYTLSTDSWRKVDVSVQSLSGNIIDVGATPCLFFNGALHSIAYTKDHTFILSFDVNDEKFREIMLPQDYLDEEFVYSKRLVVFKGALALIAFVKEDDDLYDSMEVCYIWVMREYGVVESWTKKVVQMGNFLHFYGCTGNGGEFLISKGFDTVQLFSIDPDNQSENNHQASRRFVLEFKIH